MIYDPSFLAVLGSVPPVVASPIALSPHDPGNLGTAPQTWTTTVNAPGQTQVKWFVGINGSKTINFARGTTPATVPNYNHGDTVNFTGFGSGFTIVRSGTTGSIFTVQGASGSQNVTIGNETAVVDISYTVEGTGGNSTAAYTTLNLTNGSATLSVTFRRAGDTLVVKSLDETLQDISGPVSFSGTIARTITLTPHGPGDLGTAPANWTTTVTATGMTQVTWIVLDSNFVGSGTTSFTVVDLVNGTAQITCQFLKPGDMLVVKSLDYVIQDVSDPVAFSGVAKSISLSPSSPGDLGSAPKNWTTTATANGLTQVKWAVFDANYNSSMTWQVVNVVNNTVSITCTFNQAGERLVVKSIDDAQQIVSSQVAFGTVTVPPTVSDDLQFVKNWKSRLAMGINLERNNALGKDVAYFTKLKNDGDLTHIRFFIPTKASWGLAGSGTVSAFCDAAAAAISAGFLGVHLDLQDVCEPGDLQDSRTLPYINMCGDVIASKNLDPTKLIIGGVQEYAYMTNTFYQPFRESYRSSLRSRLPNHIIAENSANWGDPYTLIDGSFAFSSDKRIIYQWHAYPNDAENLSAMQNLGNNLLNFENTNNVVIYNGEHGIGPANGSRAQEYNTTPTVINNAYRGLGEQRPTMWTLTDGSYWRLNNSGDYNLRSDFAANFKAGSAYIRQQSYYSVSTPTPGPVATPGVVTNVDILHRGQSNAYYADQYNAPGMLKDTLQSLTGVTVNMISRRETTNNTIHSGTYSFWKNPYNSEGRWLDPTNLDYTTNPANWANRGPASETLAAVAAYVSSDKTVPLIDLRLHWEYDLGVFDGAANDAYREGAWEISKRIMATRPKDAGKTLHAYAYCPYQGGGWNNLGNMMNAWGLDMADGNRDAFYACGNMMDGQKNTQYDPNGDSSHWGDQSGPRIYPRIAFNFAKIFFNRGWLSSSKDLNDCPSMGPKMISATRSGNSVNVVTSQDKGTALVPGQGGIDWPAFTVSDTTGNYTEATGGAITGANTIRVDFSSIGSGYNKIDYCYFPVFRNRNLIRDNWHTIRGSKYASVPNIAVVEFPLQRTTSGIVF